MFRVRSFYELYEICLRFVQICLSIQRFVSEHRSGNKYSTYTFFPDRDPYGIESRFAEYVISGPWNKVHRVLDSRNARKNRNSSDRGHLSIVGLAAGRTQNAENARTLTNDNDDTHIINYTYVYARLTRNIFQRFSRNLNYSR